MKRRRALWLGACLAALTRLVPAQSDPAPASPAGAALPLRNLLIEVRQIGQDSRMRERLDASIAARVRPGESDASIGITARADQSRRSDSAQQHVLVLNGRRAAIMLGQSVALQLLQTVRRNGVWRNVPGTLWLQAGTGFDALPRWDGSDMVELELSANQSRGTVVGPGAGNAAVSTTLMLPLGEWTTIAESAQELDGEQGGLTGGRRQSGQSSLKVQVRISAQ